MTTTRTLRRELAYAYGWAAYAGALATILYAVGFLADVVVPKSIDAGSTHALGDPLLVDLALVGLFGLQHSLMARPGFKERKAEAERRIVVTALERNDWHITRTADELDLADHASLLKIMRRLGIEREDS